MGFLLLKPQNVYSDISSVIFISPVGIKLARCPKIVLTFSSRSKAICSIALPDLNKSSDVYLVSPVFLFGLSDSKSSISLEISISFSSQ